MSGNLMTEHDLRKKVSAYFKARPLWFMQKISDKFTAGIPDYMGCYRGLFVCLELKSKRYKPTALQLHTGKHIQKTGGLWLVIYSIEELKEWVEKIELGHFGLIKEKRSSSAKTKTSSDY